jgi:fluoroacetyl-CoA thioesterase
MATTGDPAPPASVVGTAAEVRMEVTAADTAIAAGSGDLPVLATPRLIALMEAAACSALAPTLPAEATSVGSHVDVRHLRPSPVGVGVVARAEVVEVSGSRVTFAVTATHDDGSGPVEIGRGVHVRHVVDRSRFPG